MAVLEEVTVYDGTTTVSIIASDGDEYIVEEAAYPVPGAPWSDADFLTLLAASIEAGDNITVDVVDGVLVITGEEGGGGGGGAANLAYVAAPTGGTVTSDTGTDATIPLSDGSNAGLLSPAQHAKLATIEAGATGDQTAAEILALLLTVDGTGSGLDADLLDGQSGAYYLARGNHTGTQQASTISDFDTQVRTSRLDQMAAPTAAVGFGGQRITNVATPSSDTDAATKAYVDAAAAGIDWKASVRAATTGPVTLASGLENGDTIDGVVLATGDRVLVKDQAAGAENGIYVVAASGAPTRATDADAAAEVTGGIATFVEAGTTNADTGWVLTNDGAVVVGTTALTFTQFTGLGQVVAGAALTKTGNTIDVNAGAGIVIVADAVAVDDAADFDWTGAHTFTDPIAFGPGDSSISSDGTTTSIFSSSEPIELNGLHVAIGTAGVGLTVGRAPSAPEMGGAEAVISIGDAPTPPGSNPASGVIVYSEAGQLKVRQADGTIVVVGSVDEAADYAWTGDHAFTEPVVVGDAGVDAVLVNPDGSITFRTSINGDTVIDPDGSSQSGVLFTALGGLEVVTGAPVSLQATTVKVDNFEVGHIHDGSQYLGSGDGVVAIAESATNPSADPGSGVVAYVEGGRLHIRDQHGVVSTVTATSARPVRVATTANIDLTGNENIDGVNVATGDRVLVKDQTTAVEDGIYVVNTAGAWARASDMPDGTAVPAGMTVFVLEGATNGEKLMFLDASAPVAVGAAQTWTAISAGTVPGTDVTIDSGAFNVITPDDAQELAQTLDLHMWTAIQNQHDSGQIDWASAPSVGALSLNADGADLDVYLQLISKLLDIGLVKHVRLATTANHGLSGGAAIDGVDPNVGDLVLVKNQTTPSENGLYVVGLGAWGRHKTWGAGLTTYSIDDMRGGMLVTVAEGDTQADTLWQMSSDVDPVVVGTTAVTFAQVGAGAAPPSDGASLATVYAFGG